MCRMLHLPIQYKYWSKYYEFTAGLEQFHEIGQSGVLKFGA